MTVHRKPAQAQIVGDAIRAGLIETPDDVVDVGVETIRQRLDTRAEAPASGKSLPVHVTARISSISLQNLRSKVLISILNAIGRDIEL